MMHDIVLGEQTGMKTELFQTNVKSEGVISVADPGFLKGGGARSAPQNLAPPTFYILMAHAQHEQNRTRTSELAKFRGGI